MTDLQWDTLSPNLHDRSHPAVRLRDETPASRNDGLEVARTRPMDAQVRRDRRRGPEYNVPNRAGTGRAAALRAYVIVGSSS